MSAPPRFPQGPGPARASRAPWIALGAIVVGVGIVLAVVAVAGRGDSDSDAASQNPGSGGSAGGAGVQDTVRAAFDAAKNRDLSGYLSHVCAGDRSLPNNGIPDGAQNGIESYRINRVTMADDSRATVSMSLSFAGRNLQASVPLVNDGGWKICFSSAQGGAGSGAQSDRAGASSAGTPAVGTPRSAAAAGGCGPQDSGYHVAVDLSFALEYKDDPHPCVYPGTVPQAELDRLSGRDFTIDEDRETGGPGYQFHVDDEPLTIETARRDGRYWVVGLHR